MKQNNMTCRLLIISLAMLTGASALAQKKIGDFIESRSNNADKRGVARSLQYTPKHGGFYAENGNNRFTRALYGGYTDWRVETSDRPIFAVFKKGHHRSIRFVLNGVLIDEAEHCTSLYRNAMREYTISDKRWSKGGQGVVSIGVAAMPDEEAAVFRFEGDGLREYNLKTLVCNISNKRMRRNGDMGADPAGVFEPADDQKGLAVSDATYGAGGNVAYVVIRLNEAVNIAFHEADYLWNKAVEYNTALSSRIRFETPDPYINTLGGALAVAADGDWDGQTWLHGCVGWRMPLAGWRAGYLGDVLGWNDRARSHFDAYAKSQVNAVPPTIPHPSNDPAMNLARAEKKWGTQMYSNGYICRYPDKNNNMHHYDMNLNYMDELLWHFQYNADTAYMRKMWPVIKAHLAWEKRNYDPDGDHLYDAYCCIWASDALYYNGGAVTHSSAYNYRGNRLAGRIAELIGEDARPYHDEADAIQKAMNERLWLADKGHWAEFEDLMGLKRKHESAAVWSVYTPIDCGVGTGEQAYRATRYVDREIPHIDVEDSGLKTISTSNWMPYSWSINNVAAAEVMHTALAFFEAGRNEAGYRLMKANIMDQMYYGGSPANFGQVSYYDAARGECYRDFGDCIGISARTLIQGFFGVVPEALYGRCIIRPGFPREWESASLTTPYLSYKYRREGSKAVFEVTQNFKQPLKIVIRQNLGEGKYIDVEGSAEKHQVITVDVPAAKPDPADDVYVQKLVDADAYGLGEPEKGKFTKVNMDVLMNSEVDDIYKNKYLSPRPQVTTLQIPTQGIGEWCHPTLDADINDSVFRTLVKKEEFKVAGVPFRTFREGKNIAYTSLWDNYPAEISVPLKGKAEWAYLLMAGSTNHMQCRIDNGLVIATYKDGTTDTLRLVNPDNWCPIEQDFYVDGKAFYTTQQRPYRVALGTGTVSRNLGEELGISEVYGRPIPGGAAQMLKMPLDKKKELKSLTLRTLSNDVVIGLMAVTLAK